MQMVAMGRIDESGDVAGEFLNRFGGAYLQLADDPGERFYGICNNCLIGNDGARKFARRLFRLQHMAQPDQRCVSAIVSFRPKNIALDQRSNNIEWIPVS